VISGAHRVVSLARHCFSCSLMMLLICCWYGYFLQTLCWWYKTPFNVILQLCHLNYVINRLYEWSNVHVWQPQIAVDSFVCNIHPGNQRPNVDLYNYVLNIHVHEKDDVVPDLGVHVDCFLMFDCQISFIVHKLKTRLMLKSFLSRDCKVLFKAYCGLCTSLTRILFCCLVTSPQVFGG